MSIPHDDFDWAGDATQAEPERYELREGPFYHFEVTRREFVSAVGAGLVLSVVVAPALGQRAGRGTGDRRPPLAQRLHLDPDGTVSVLSSKVEVGQGSRTQLTQAAAEELHLPVERVRFVLGDTAGPDDGGTAGSRTTPASVPAIRRACAAARQLLIETADRKFAVESARLSVHNGQGVGLPGGQSFAYRDLAAAENQAVLQQEVGSDVPLAGVKQWTILGTATPRIGSREIVTGAHRYPSDIVRPAMEYGRMLRPPGYGASLIEVDLDAARSWPGVTVVRDGDFIGVAAATSFAATEAIEAVARTARWKAAPQVSSEGLFAELRAKASTRSRPEIKGNPDERFKVGGRVLRESYQVAYIQHAPMEPRAAVAEWTGENLTVWTGSQQPARVRQDLAESLRVPADKVRVIIPDTGGGFGGKHSGEVAVEAARLARAAGRPVQVRWSREEEFTWAYFRPAGVIDVAGALDEEGTLHAWEQVNFNSGSSALATPYAIAHTRSEFRPCDQPLRSGSYRGLAATANTFARESFMDELAAAASRDPLEFRTRHLTNERLQAVLSAATRAFRWGHAWQPASTSRRTGVGLACSTEKGSYVACCAEVSVGDDGTFRVTRVAEAFECGAIQNPANLKAQVDGAILMGLGGALTEAMEFRDGKLQNASFGRYRVPRLKDVPAVETVLLNRPDLPSVGAGETPLIAIAPAVANALFNATRVRLRALPLRNGQYRPV